MERQSHALTFCLLTDCKQTLFGGTAHQSSDTPLDVFGWESQKFQPRLSKILITGIIGRMSA